MRARRAGFVAIVVTLLVVAVSAAGSSFGGSASSSANAGPRVGTPWTGVRGVTRTTAQIMALQRARGHRPARTVPEREVELEKGPNPDSPVAPPRQAREPAAPTLSVGTSFTGTTLSESGAVPPDSMGAVGPSQFLVGVNGRIKVFSKAGAVGALDADLDVFFSSVMSPASGTFTTDPRVRYDPLTGRWFVLCIDATPPSFINNRVLLAVSDDGTIDGGTVWTFFFFQQQLVSPAGDTNTLADFPTLGLDANALYVGANMFTTTSFSNTTLFVIRKSSVTGGGPIVVSAFRGLLDGSFNGLYTPQGVDNLDPAATEGYVVGVDGSLFGKLDVRRISNPGGTPSISGNFGITVASTALPMNPIVLGSTKPLDGIDDRLNSSSIQGGKLYTSHNIGLNSGGVATGSPTRTGVRWYELQNLTTTPSLARSGTIFDSAASNAKSYWMPSIAVSGQGHAVIGVTSGGANARPNGGTSSMLSSESAFSTPVDYTAASQNYNVDTGDSVYRWGDYSHTSIDPCDRQTFWTIQEFTSSTNNWGVRVGKLTAPPPATPVSAAPALVTTGLASTSVVLTGSSTGGSGFFDTGSGACRLQVAVDGNVTVNGVTFTDPTHLTLDVSTVGARAGLRTVTVTNPDGQVTAAAVLGVRTKAHPPGR